MLLKSVNLVINTSKENVFLSKIGLLKRDKSDIPSPKKTKGHLRYSCNYLMKLFTLVDYWDIFVLEL